MHGVIVLELIAIDLDFKIEEISVYNFRKKTIFLQG